MFAANANAVNPDEVLKNSGLESRARVLSKEIRCMVCQNQSIDDSDASVAKDLRLLIRERIVAGDSDTQVLDYLVSRFGEFVLLKPRFSAGNLILWATPILALLLGIFLLIGIMRRSKLQNISENKFDLAKDSIDKKGASAPSTPTPNTKLSKEEKSQITKILSESD